MRTFTLEELSQYNGKDGQPAYVAVDGVVYDVTNVEAWKNGDHKLGLTAGNELTEEITNLSPHGKKVLERLPIVGELVE
ncbi:cytochrome b5 domain-containing protein [Trichococcus sp. K1Tr]|uniref:cytochrome b5 domain-containing protein n=1 Tax=Trichococcus sp. K1Tr TaxID=3020847 RepID=UPI00232F17B9|nr:cytochrome b5 domain-containing protein [Trichococcus sp. K1Tr]MDB6352927.1 cytochrome b5 domain-containing protein [Trichococcus sp. K1Tr]